MLRFALRRLLAVVPILLLVSAGAFLLLQAAPGDPAAAIAGDSASPEMIEQIREEMGLNEPLWIQYLSFIGAVLTGDLGVSWQNGQPVLDAILNRVPVTLSMVVLVLICCIIIAVPIGIIAGARANSVLDRVLVAISAIGMASPPFLLGLILVAVFSFQLGLLPATGYEPLGESPSGWLEHLILPVVALAMIPMAEVVRIARASMQESLEQDYIRTAWAKGIPGGAIVVRHALRNSLSPVTTVLGLQVARIIGGAVVVEQVFNLPGLGTLTIQSVLSSDAPMIMGIVLFVSIAVVVVNLCVDLFNYATNPRSQR